MKKIALLVAAAMSLSLLFGCGAKQAAPAPAPSAPAPSAPAASAPAEAPAPEEIAYPEGTITFYIPANPGGDTDTYMRIFATALEKELGVSCQIVNKATCAECLIETEMNPADGYSVYWCHSSQFLNEMSGTCETKLFDAMEIISVPVQDCSGTIAVSGEKWKSVDEFLADVKAGEQIIATTGIGSVAHLGTELIAKQLGMNTKLIDSTSMADRYTDVMSGRADLMYGTYGVMEQYFEAGTFLSLGVMAEERLEAFPDVPTLKENGIDLTFTKPFFFSMKKGTDPQIIEKFAKAVEAACASEEVIEQFKAYSVTPSYMGPEESTAFLKEVSETYQPFQEVLFG